MLDWNGVKCDPCGLDHFDTDGSYQHISLISVTRSTEMRNKSGHVKPGKSTSKSVGDDFALKC